MSLFRILQFPVEDSYFGSYLCRIPVIPDDYKDEIQTVIATGSVGSIEELISDLSYYGVGNTFIDLFTDLRYNNIPLGTPPGYDSGFLLHQVYPNIASVNERTEIILSNSAKVYDSSISLYNKVTIANDNGVDYSTTFYAHNGNDISYLLDHSITLNERDTAFNGFTITVYGVFASDLNGNKFNFTQESTAPRLQILVNHSKTKVGTVEEHTWGYTIVVFDLGLPIGLNLKNAMDGQEADDAEQDSDDPYDDGGDSQGGGGGGNFDDSSDNVDFPDLPTISATDTGFITLFVPSITQLQNLATYMWTDPTFDLEFWRKIMADPMDAILGLSIVPYAVPAAGSVNVTVGNISTNVAMNKASAQFFALDCGTVTLDEYFGSYLDYEPYTSIDIYLPFIGIRKLSTDDLIPKSVHVKYHIDILTGSCVAMIKCSKDGHGGVMYTYQGNCATEIPVTSIGFGNTVRSAISFGTSAATLISTGGGAAPAAIGGMANSVMNAKPTITKSNNIGASGGLMANKTPYLIIHRPNQCKPANQNKYLGYPAFITENVSGLSGFTSFEAIRLNNIKCNDEEMTEIMQLLKEGVIL